MKNGVKNQIWLLFYMDENLLCSSCFMHRKKRKRKKKMPIYSGMPKFAFFSFSSRKVSSHFEFNQGCQILKHTLQIQKSWHIISLFTTHLKQSNIWTNSIL